MRRVFRDFRVLLASSKRNYHEYRKLLEEQGFRKITYTQDDTEVIDLARRISPDVAVIAGCLDGLSGMQLMVAVKQYSQGRNLPFLFLGLNTELTDNQSGQTIWNDRNAFLLKRPFNKDALSDALKKLLEPVIDKNKEKAYELSDEGDSRKEAGDNVTAAKLYRESLEKFGKNLEVCLKLAATLLEMDSLDEAEKTYLNTLDINNCCLPAYFGLADLYERKNDYEHCLSLLKQAMGVAKLLKAKDVYLSRINFYIGEFQIRLKRLAEARKSFEKAITQNPEDAQLQVNIGDVYATNGYYAESQEYYESAIDMDIDMAHVLNKLGIAYRKQKEYEKALNLYSKACEHHPEDENILFNIARIHYEAGMNDEASVVLQHALELSPTFVEARKFLRLIEQKGTVIELDCDLN